MMTNNSEIGVYRPRSIAFTGQWRVADFRLKSYALSYTGTEIGADLVEATRKLAAERIRESAARTRHYGVGFVGIHAGKTADFVFVDWWAEENELHHHVYVGRPGEPAALEYATPTGLSACVWDLALIGHERDAWVRCVLETGDVASGIEAYLEQTLTAHI